MITTEQYFRKPHSQAQEVAAADLIARRNALRASWMASTGKTCPVDPDTGSEISGSPNGDGDGGFRTPGSTTGVANSAHRRATGIDDYDPDNAFDDWLTQFDTEDGGNQVLEDHGLYREHPSKTPRWAHLQTEAPASGHRTFMP